MRRTSKKPAFIQKKASSLTFLERELQQAICMEFDLAIKAGANFTYAGDMNATKRSAHEMQWAIATGMKSGETDMRIYLPGGRTIMIELKVKGKGSVSKAQRERHALLKELGFDVRVWRYKTPTEAAQAARELIVELREHYEV